MSRRANNRSRSSAIDHAMRGVCEPLEPRRLLAASLVYGGSQTLVPGTTINVSATGAIAESEMSLVVNPTNPLNLVGFSHRLTTPILVDVYSSSDGGATWSTNTINNADDSFGTTGNRFDPAVGFDANGVCYIVYGHREPGTPNRTRLIGARSTDGGVNFGNYRTIDIQNDRGASPGLDKWYIHSGPDPASGNQAMYVGWVHFAVEGAGGTVNDDRILIAGTRDVGDTWTAPLLLNDPAATGAETGPTYASPVVGRNGEVAVTWHDMGDDTVMLDRDLDGLWGGPATFGTDITVRTGVTVERSAMLPPAQPERGVNAAPMLEVWRNTNWLLETHVEQFGTGNDLDIWLGISQNFGETWSFQRVEGATSTDFNPWLQVDQRTGVFHVLYLSTDGDGSGNDDIRPKIATSFDAGANWQRGFLSTQTSNEAGGYAGDYLEYHGLAARDGTVHGLWPSRYGGGGQDLDVFTANAAYVSNISDNRLVIGETGGAGDDNYLVRLAPNNSAFLEVFVDGVREFTGLRQSINSIIFNPGGGTNSFSIATIPGLSALTINGTNNADTIRIDALGANLPTLNMVLVAGDDTVTLGQDLTSFLTINSPVSISGQDGSDTLNYGNGSASAIATNVSFDGGGGGFIDTVDVNDGAMTSTVEYDIGPTSMIRNAFGSLSTLNHSNLEDIEIFAGSGGDQFTLRNNVGPVVRCFGNSGNDNFTFGDGLLSPNSGAVFNAGPGADTLTLDDRNNPSGRFWDIFNDRVIYAGAVVFTTVGFEGVTVLAGNGGDTLHMANQTFSQAITFDAGGGNDSVNTNTSIVPNLTLRGGAGTFDNLNMDDRNFPAGGLSFATYYADRIVRTYPSATTTTHYATFEGGTYYLPSSTNEVQVFGVPINGAGNSFQIIGNSLADTFIVYPTPATPNINGALYLIGNAGTDLAALVDNGTTPETYRLQNPVSGAAFIYGSFAPGAAYVGVEANIENLSIYGGNAGDTFSVDKYTSGIGLNLFGGGGNDTSVIGNGNMQANLTNAAFFNYDGGGGTGDRFIIDNTTSTSAWNYGINTTLVGSEIPGVYTWLATVTSVENRYIHSGSGGDTCSFYAVPSGTYAEFNGSGGYDVAVLGNSLFGIHPQNIQSKAVFNAGAGGGRAYIDDTGDSTGDVVHLTDTTLGAFTGDTFFGPGGSFTFSGLSNSGSTEGLTILCSLGSDTVYAQPLAGARVVIFGIDAEETGDTLRLATAGLTSPVINGTPDSGNLTSGNRQTLSWNGFEGSITTDSVSPAVIDGVINVNGIPGFADSGNTQTVDVQFSENVAGLLSPASLQLNNLTTGQTIPTANIAVTWEAATNTAHFTFPGYPFGVLPDGDYSGRIFAGLPDFFGNPLPADANFSFFFMQGDANRDRSVNSDDFNILASNFGQSNRTFSQADFNYDGTVNSDDFNILAGKFGTALGSGASTFAQPSLQRRTRLIDSLWSTDPDSQVEIL